MRDGSDGVEVAATSDEAVSWPLAPLLVLDRLVAYLDGIGQGSGPLHWERIGDGHSNITYRIQREGADVVLRRGPRPPLPRSAHDMVREARIQRILGGRDVPAPRIIDVCENESVLGVPFYLMGWLEGIVVTDDLPPALSGPADRSGLATASIDALVALHSVELDDDVATLGRPDGYLRRQVERFAGLWDVNTTRDVPQVKELADWLLANLPETQRHSVVHGDFRIGNLMLAPNAPARVTAILDWEMATLGDPLADLGYFTATYADPASGSTVMELTSVTRGEGFPTAADLAQRYAAATGLDLTPLPWYETLALWKAAVFCEAMYTRWLHGERPGDTFAPPLDHEVPRLLEVAQQSAGLAPRL